MKVFHLADLHIGKKINEFSLLEDQIYILKEIVQCIDKERPDAVLIAGDVYDKPVPTIEAVQVLNDFLNQISVRKIPVFMVSGNHDSMERMAFASELIVQSGVHISPIYSGKEEPVILRDEYGTVNLYMLPFVKPVHVRTALQKEDVKTYTEAMREAIEQMKVNPQERNILITHQFVAGAVTSDSEEVRAVGGSDQIDVSVFDSFDYVALGHLHRPQKVKRETVRYAGSPLKYSFSEVSDNKSITIVDLEEKGTIRVSAYPLKPLRDMQELKGTYDTLVSKTFYKTVNTDDYIHITLTDEEDVLDAVEKLRLIYPNLLRLDYENSRTQLNGGEITLLLDEVEKKTPFDLISDFYKDQNGTELTDFQTDYLKEVIGQIWTK